jgi:hypothetical protein
LGAVLGLHHLTSLEFVTVKWSAALRHRSAILEFVDHFRPISVLY